jgi:hypothetical protein
VRHTIFKGLAGGDSEDECLDLTEIVAILLIPFFRKMEQNENEATRLVSQERTQIEETQPLEDYPNAKDHAPETSANDEGVETKKIMAELENENFIQNVLDIILRDVTGSAEPQVLTKELIISMFARYEETELVQDDGLIEDMINAATGGIPGALLDGDTFLRALTTDLNLYNVSHESRCSTHFDDVGLGDTARRRNLKEEIDEEGMNVVHEEKQVEIVFTCSQLDMLANTYRSSLHILLGYTGIILLFFTYVNREDLSIWVTVCDSKGFGCQVANRLILWILILCVFT